VLAVVLLGERAVDQDELRRRFFARQKIQQTTPRTTQTRARTLTSMIVKTSCPVSSTPPPPACASGPRCARAD